MKPQISQIDTEKERDPQTYAVIGAVMEVHRHLGHGFLEAVYQEALAIELTNRQIPYEREASLPIRYKGTVLSHPYRADFICHGEIIVELKAIERLTNIEYAQIIHYLKATGYHRGLLINFGTQKLDYRRFING